MAEQFDAVILDPPKFVHTQAQIERAHTLYRQGEKAQSLATLTGWRIEDIRSVGEGN